jgi:hypothetical protein
MRKPEADEQLPPICVEVRASHAKRESRDAPASSNSHGHGRCRQLRLEHSRVEAFDPHARTWHEPREDELARSMVLQTKHLAQQIGARPFCRWCVGDRRARVAQGKARGKPWIDAQGCKLRARGQARGPRTIRPGADERARQLDGW